MKLEQPVAALPAFFKSILWSYDFKKLDPQKDSRIIIFQTINYGTLAHWKWIKDFYGLAEIRKIISEIPVTAFRPSALRLATLIFRLTQLNYAPRGPHR